jgi:hypothetical protein
MFDVVSEDFPDSVREEYLDTIGPLAFIDEWDEELEEIGRRAEESRTTRVKFGALRVWKVLYVALDVWSIW